MVIPARLRDNSTIDVLPALLHAPGAGFDSHAPVSYAAPHCTICTMRTDRWAKLFENLHRGWGTDKKREPRIVAQRLAFGQWICRSWNAAHRHDKSRELMAWNLTFVSLNNYGPIPLGDDGWVHLKETSRMIVWRHHCFE